MAKSYFDEVVVPLTGQALLAHSLFNKGSAFTEAERQEFGVNGLLPPHVSTLQEQLDRTYQNFRKKESDLERYVFLISLQDRNETLFYALLREHIVEMMPIVYTPVVGDASRFYSRIYRRPRGLFISFPQMKQMRAILKNAAIRRPRVIVVTDGERILGLGDLGVGGMGIPVGKLTLYTLCAGIHPGGTLPIVLDVGTDNKELLADPLYLGWRHNRVRGAGYDAFIEAFVQAVMKAFPGVILQWEDFAKDNAARLLEKYRDRLCTFNDDIQGTGAVTLAGLRAAVQAANGRLRDQRVVLLGAGSAATGIAEQICADMMEDGLTREQALGALWLIDSHGLVHTKREKLEPAKRRYAQPFEKLADWPLGDDGIGLADVVRNVRPTALIGISAQPGAFTKEIVTEMATHASRPIILPLSNPTSKSEAVPADLLAWTAGRAVVATGSPFPDVAVDGRTIRIGQCNNAYIFPGVGLGVLASGAKRITTGLFRAAAHALSELSPARENPADPLFPPMSRIREVSFEVARAVALQAQKEKLAPALALPDLEERIRAEMWEPGYSKYRKPS